MTRKRQHGGGEVAGVNDARADGTHEAGGLEEKTQPAQVVRIRNVRAAIWQNARPDGSTWYSTTFSRSYRSDDGSWHSTDSFGGNDLLTLAELARQAFLWIVEATQGGDTPF